MKNKFLSLIMILFLITIYFKDGTTKSYPGLGISQIFVRYKMIKIQVGCFKYDYYNVDDIKKIEVR